MMVLDGSSLETNACLYKNVMVIHSMVVEIFSLHQSSGLTDRQTGIGSSLTSHRCEERCKDRKQGDVFLAKWDVLSSEPSSDAMSGSYDGDIAGSAVANFDDLWVICPYIQTVQTVIRAHSYHCLYCVFLWVQIIMYCSDTKYGWNFLMAAMFFYSVCKFIIQ